MKKLFRNRKNKGDKHTGDVQQEFETPDNVPVPQEAYDRAPSSRVTYQQGSSPQLQQQYSQRQQQQQYQQQQVQYQQQHQQQYQQAPPPAASGSPRANPPRAKTTTTVRNIPAPSQTSVRQVPPPASSSVQQLTATTSPAVKQAPPAAVNSVKDAPSSPAGTASMPHSSGGRNRHPAPTAAMGQSVSHLPTNDANVTREVVKKFIADIWNRGDLDLIPEVCHRSLRFNGSVGMDRVGHDGFARMVQTIRDALSDYHCEIHSMVVEGNKAFVRMRFTGRHTGALLGFEPTGRQVAWMGASEFTIKDGKILKVWELGDVKSLEQQLYPEDEM